MRHSDKSRFSVHGTGVHRFRWSKREEQDFYRTISCYGIVRDPATCRYDWSKFRQVLAVEWSTALQHACLCVRVVAKLEKKGNDRLSQYYEEFLDMCHIVCSKGGVKAGMRQLRTGTCTEHGEDTFADWLVLDQGNLVLSQSLRRRQVEFCNVSSCCQLSVKRLGKSTSALSRDW